VITTFASHDDDRAVRSLDARADDSDARDYLYQPTIKLLPESLDQRRLVPRILDQGSEGACVGYALAAVINMSLSRKGERTPRKNEKTLASARMLYEMARRYDEWKGVGYSGTSPRGAMKAWHHVGVASERTWSNESEDRELTVERAEDARSRPLGAYYRVRDSDPIHVQAAVVEGDAVLASMWVHSGWRNDQLLPPIKGGAPIKRIESRPAGRGLHAIAIIGYSADGLIVQNSWGPKWGTGGFAVLAYDDWFENRQDAWVARPGPRTNDSGGRARIFLGGFAGDTAASRSETSAEGLEIPDGALPFFINTGDRGGLDGTHRLKTRVEELPAMAVKVRDQPAVNGQRHVILYAHGGLDAESDGVEIASRIYGVCHEHQQTAYFFVWETGKYESVLGLLRSRDDATGPGAVGFSIPDILRTVKKGAVDAGRAVQKAVGSASASVIRPIWKEMTGRAEGASSAKGGGRLFVAGLLKAMRDDDRGVPYVLHLVGHSAGTIYLSFLWDQVLRAELTDPIIAGTAVTLGSIHLMAPAISVGDADARFMPGGALPIARKNFRVYMLSDEHELSDNIGVYPSSLLTYVADHLEAKKGRVPILGIASDFRKRYKNGGGPLPIAAFPGTEQHGQFDDEGHEIDTIIEEIAAGKYS
jgi:hypothetical protein